MFVRFVIHSNDEESGRRQGVFQAAYKLLEEDTLATWDHHALRANLTWFSKNLDAPERFSRARRPGAGSDAISWYKDTAKNHIGRMHDICRILNESGVATEMIMTDRPGYIVYEDECQVAAAPFSETAT